jgi:hypothetical protein
VRAQDAKYRESPDIVLKVVCRYRAELFFKISRNTKLARLFNAWTGRMETLSANGKRNGQKQGTFNGTTTYTTSAGRPVNTYNQFVFTHSGRTLDSELTPEEAGMDDGDEILAVELMDLTEGPEFLVNSSLIVVSGYTTRMFIIIFLTG